METQPMSGDALAALQLREEEERQRREGMEELLLESLEVRPCDIRLEGMRRWNKGSLGRASWRAGCDIKAVCAWGADGRACA